GAPDKIDEVGFNKIHFKALMPFLRYEVGSELQISEAVNALNILKRYSNTQVRNYDALYRNVLNDINSSLQITESPIVNENKITYLGKNDAYGKIVFYIPSHLVKTKELEALISQAMEAMSKN